MSEESEDLTPDDDTSIEASDGYTSPLRIMLMEIHEVYQELLLVGFSKPIAVQIVAHMIQDAMMYRSVEDDEDDDTDLNDESDTDDDQGFG